MGSMVVGVVVSAFLLTPFFVFTGCGVAAMMGGWLCTGWGLERVGVVVEGAPAGVSAVAGEVPLS